jgi:hypothetical protein
MAQKLYERFIQDGAQRQIALSDLSVAKIRMFLPASLQV